MINAEATIKAVLYKFDGEIINVRTIESIAQALAYQYEMGIDIGIAEKMKEIERQVKSKIMNLTEQELEKMGYVRSPKNE